MGLSRYAVFEFLEKYGIFKALDLMIETHYRFLTLSYQRQSIIHLYDESYSNIEDSLSLQKSFPI